MIVAALKRRGVLGINRRNADYTLAWNQRGLYPLVDDKLVTKRLCQEAGIPVPRLLAVAVTPPGGFDDGFDDGFGATAAAFDDGFDEGFGGGAVVIEPVYQVGSTTLFH